MTTVANLDTTALNGMTANEYVMLMHVASRIDQAGLNTSEIPDLLLGTGWTPVKQVNSTRDSVNGSGYGGVIFQNTDGRVVLVNIGSNFGDGGDDRFADFSFGVGIGNQYVAEAQSFFSDIFIGTYNVPGNRLYIAGESLAGVANMVDLGLASQLNSNPIQGAFGTNTLNINSATAPSRVLKKSLVSRGVFRDNKAISI